MQPVQNAPTGSMNKDLDPRYLNKGNYRDARNVRPITDGGGTTNSIEAVRGTLKKVEPITVPSQNKFYRVECVSGSGNVHAKIFDEQGNLKYNSAAASGDVSAGLQVLLNRFAGISATELSNNVVEAEIENGNEWVIEVTSVTDDIKDQYVYQEEISGGDNTGVLYWIGAKEYNDRLYVWGTTCFNPGGGTGEIGVIQKNFGGNIVYTRLIRSKDFKFSTQYDFDADVEENDFRTSLYWTDFNNSLKTLFHRAITGDDFVLRFNGGDYDYGSIATQTNLIPEVTGSRIDFKDQLQSGGAINSGSWRYTYRFLTENLEESSFGTLTNQIPVFVEGVVTGNNSIRGSQPDIETSKINRLEVSGIDLDRYTFIELIGVHYIGSTPQGFILKRERIDGETMELRHTGNEANVRNLGNLADLINSEAGIETALNLRINKNRLFISNIKFRAEKYNEELKAIADNITVTEGTQKIDGVVGYEDLSEEYTVPLNVHDKTGYCPGETYRFGIRFGFVDGTFSPTFHVEDYQFELNAQTRLTVGRNGPGSFIQDPQIKYPVFQNINIPDSLKSEIVSYQVMRVEMDESMREILATGFAVPYYDATSQIGKYIPYIPSFNRPSSPRTILFISPDVTFGGAVLDFRSGDEIVYSSIEIYSSSQVSSGEVNITVFQEYDGDTSHYRAVYSIEDMQFIARGGSGSLLVNGQSEEFSHIETITGDTVSWASGYAISLGGTLPDLSGSFEDGDFVFYRRPKTDKFGSKDTSRYIPCEQPVFDLNKTSHSFFGGDSYTQKTFRKISNDLDGDSSGMGVVSFYSVNRVNSQLRYDHDGSSGWDIFPQTVDLSTFVDNDVREQIQYDDSYSFQNLVQRYQAYDPEREDVTNAETRIYFSKLKPVNSFKEVYGDFPPLNYKDVDLAYGPINHMEIYNGELVHWQDRAVSREYVNAKGLINPEDSTEVLIGSNEVLSRKEDKLSSYGTSHKYSVVKGRGMRGSDVLYWVNAIYNKILRMGYDGVTPLSDRDGMNSWASNELEGHFGIDNPVHQGGIHGVWDSRFGEYIMTKIRPNLGLVPGWTYANAQNAASSVIRGTAYVDTGNIFTFNDVIYKTTGTVIVSSPFDVYAKSPLNTPSKWKLASTTDAVLGGGPNAFDAETLSLNEYKDGFITFYDFTPRIYMPFRDAFFSENPFDQSIHIHNEGDYMVFHGIEHQGNIKIPINDRPNIPKAFRAIMIKSENKPYSVKFETRDHESYLVASDFTYREGMWMSPIKLDSSVTGSNDGETEILRGDYLFVNFEFESKNYQTLFNFVVGTEESARNIKA